MPATQKTTKKKTAKKTPAKAGSKKVGSAEKHYLKIQEAAYLKAEADGFKMDPADYWLAAEAEIDSVG